MYQSLYTCIFYAFCIEMNRINLKMNLFRGHCSINGRVGQRFKTVWKMSATSTLIRTWLKKAVGVVNLYIQFYKFLYFTLPLNLKRNLNCLLDKTSIFHNCANVNSLFCSHDINASELLDVNYCWFTQWFTTCELLLVYTVIYHMWTIVSLHSYLPHNSKTFSLNI